MGPKRFIDDERPVPDISWTLIKNSHTALIMIDGLRKQGIVIDSISLDHDLGAPRFVKEFDDTRCIVNYMIINDYWPVNLYVHTSNSVGESWLVGTIKRYSPPGILKGYGHNYWKHQQ